MRSSELVLGASWSRKQLRVLLCWRASRVKLVEVEPATAKDPYRVSQQQKLMEELGGEGDRKAYWAQRARR
jgi:hypothetical protein